MRQRVFVLSLVGAALLAGLPALAHHSTFAYYDSEISIEYKDVTVVSFEVMNPHTRLVFLVADEDGGEVEWTASTQSANVLRRMGISADSIGPGDKLTVTVSPHLDGLKLVLMTRMDWPNGDYAVLSIGPGSGVFRAESE